MNKELVIWDDSESFLESEERNTNALLAESLYKSGYEAIVRNYTGCTSDPKIIRQFFETALPSFKNIGGIGVDLGGGAGFISSSVAHFSQIQKIYCVEAVSKVVELLQPLVKKRVLADQYDKVVSVVGNFDNLLLADESLDFAFAWDSMHHSSDPVGTLKECNRVLKSGGKLVIVDRSHDNATPDEEIERMLNVVYGKEFLVENFRPPTMRLTRRENGEHEYRYSEWFTFFERAGFVVEDSVEVLGGESDHVFKLNDASVRQVKFPYSVGGFLNKREVFSLLKP